jgi:hypothetical protein
MCIYVVVIALPCIKYIKQGIAGFKGNSKVCVAKYIRNLTYPRPIKLKGYPFVVAGLRLVVPVDVFCSFSYLCIQFGDFFACIHSVLLCEGHLSIPFVSVVLPVVDYVVY